MSGFFVLGIGVFILSLVFETYGQLHWDDPEIAEGPCAFPPGEQSYRYLLTALSGVDTEFKMYLPMANKAYYRWMYQKATNQPALTQAQLDSLKPRVTFPDFVSVILYLAQGTVSIFDPPRASYKLRCIPNNIFLTNASCEVVLASPGSAPEGFGGLSVPTAMIWSDDRAFLEWHCFAGGHQIFQVFSLDPTLTQRQKDIIQDFVVDLGFKVDNFAFQVYT